MSGSIVCPRCRKEARNGLGRFCSTCGLELPVTARYEPPPVAMPPPPSVYPASYPPVPTQGPAIRQKPKAGRSIGCGTVLIIAFLLVAGISWMRSASVKSHTTVPTVVETWSPTSERILVSEIPVYSVYTPAAPALGPGSDVRITSRSAKASTGYGTRELKLTATVSFKSNRKVLVAAYVPKSFTSARMTYMAAVGGVRVSPGGLGAMETVELTYLLSNNPAAEPDPTTAEFVLYDEQGRVLQRERLSIPPTAVRPMTKY